MHTPPGVVGQPETGFPLILGRAAYAVAPAYIASRALLLAVTLAVAAIEGVSPVRLWYHWDAKWYIGIATHGYHWSLDGKPALAFFPLYPLLVHWVSSLGIPAIIASMLVSNLAFAVGLLYLYQLTLERWGSHAAHRVAWLVALFPTAFFTFAPYTESLFLLCAIAATYHARRGESLSAGLWAAAAVASRSTGLILIPCVLLALGRRNWASRIVALLPPAIAGAGYLYYLTAEHLSLLQVMSAQRSWHRALTFPWVGFTTSVGWIAQHPFYNLGWTIENIFQFSVTVLFLGLTVLAWRKIGHAEAAYCVGFWLLVLTSPEWLDAFYAPFSSMDRFVLVLFPLAGWLAARLTHRTFLHTLGISGALMGALAALHLAGGWVG